MVNTSPYPIDQFHNCAVGDTSPDNGGVTYLLDARAVLAFDLHQARFDRVVDVIESRRVPARQIPVAQTSAPWNTGNSRTVLELGQYHSLFDTLRYCVR